MILFKPAQPEELDDLFDLMRRETSEYLKDALWEIGLTESALQTKFETVGQVFIIYDEGEPAGFYWVEQRRDTLHLHGIILRPDFQGRGIGHRVMEALEHRHGRGIKTIELGVHHGNRRARRLYEDLGYRRIRYIEDMHFDIMRKSLSEDSYPDADTTR